MSMTERDGGGLVAAQPKQDVLTTSTSQREIAEAQMKMVVAQRFPRDEALIAEQIKIACQRPDLAAGAMYQYARGGSDITGPSIRLAEAIAQKWRNLDFGIRELEQRSGVSTVEAYAWDTETNVRQSKVFQVPHVRHTRKGAYGLDDPRDVYELVANQGARRLRACILGLIPGDIVEMAVRECEETLKAKADTSEVGVKKMLDAFEKYGVTREQIEGRIQRKLDAITAAQMIGLLKVFTSLKDGMSVASDWFETPEKAESPQAGNEGVKEALRKQTEAVAETPPPVQETEPEKTEPVVEEKKEEAPAQAAPPVATPPKAAKKSAPKADPKPEPAKQQNGNGQPALTDAAERPMTPKEQLRFHLPRLFGTGEQADVQALRRYLHDNAAVERLSDVATEFAQAMAEEWAKLEDGALIGYGKEEEGGE